MKILSCCVFGFAFAFAVSAVCLAQVDIYQSDAYSVEEMCAREAEQEAVQDYTDYYESCIERNRDNPLYQADSSDKDNQDSEESYSE